MTPMFLDLQRVTSAFHRYINVQIWLSLLNSHGMHQQNLDRIKLSGFRYEYSARSTCIIDIACTTLSLFVTTTLVVRSSVSIYITVGVQYNTRTSFIIHVQCDFGY